MKCNKRNKCDYPECNHAKDHEPFDVYKYMTGKNMVECKEDSYCETLGDYRRCVKTRNKK
jgi:hypothetical protein